MASEHHGGDAFMQPPPNGTQSLRLILIVLAWALAAAVIFRFFDAISLILLGVLAAASVAALLHPLVDRLPIRRGLAALVVGLGFLLTVVAIVGGIGLMMAGPIKREFKNWPQTQQKMDAKLGEWSGRFGLDEPFNTAAMGQRAADFLGKGEAAKGVADVALNVLVALAFIFIGSVYFLADRHDRLLTPLLPLLPARRRPQLRDALEELGPKLRWWLIGVVISMSLVGVVSAIGYKLAGLKFALPLAALGAAGELIPTIGPLIAFAVALLFSATQGGTQIAGAVVVWAVVQSLESYVILPMVMKKAVDMPAVVTLFSVIFWGEVLGTPGLFMAVPINLVIWSLVDHLIIRPRQAAETSSDVAAS
jgi:predicted PurR-regulated permease PerM